MADGVLAVAVEAVVETIVESLVELARIQRWLLLVAISTVEEVVSTIERPVIAV